MRIAMVAPLAYPIPPDRYGGIELVVYYLVDGLIKRGHEVTLFACDGSKSKAKLDGKWGKQMVGSSVDPKNILYSLSRVNHIAEISDQFDIVHNHDGFLLMNQAHYFHCPIITTWHVPFSENTIKDPIKSQSLKNNNIVSISYSQRKGFPHGNYAANVYNGTVDFDTYKLGKGGDDLIWFGRFDEYKGVKEAVQVALKSNHRILLAGKAETPEQIEYFNKSIKPLVDNKKVIFLGQIDAKKKNEILNKARAFLMPISWEEPFGLVMIEAMACGVPVIAFDRGSVKEIIKDKETGFIIKPGDIKGMIRAVDQAKAIDPKKCRDRVENLFSIEKMVDDYEKAYKKVIDARAQ